MFLLFMNLKSFLLFLLYFLLLISFSSLVPAKESSKRDGNKISNSSSSSKSVGDKPDISSKGHSKEQVCINQGSRFPSFSLAGKPPRKSLKGDPDELTFCRVYKSKTCCGKAQSTAALLSVRKLSSSGEASEECLSHWEALECSICHPLMGTSPSSSSSSSSSPPPICKSFCDKLFSACSHAFFSTDPNLMLLSPCSPQSAICSKAMEFASNGSDFCTLAGFKVVDDEVYEPDMYDVEPDMPSHVRFFCFDGNPSSIGLETVSTANLNKKEAKKNKKGKNSETLQNKLKSFVRKVLLGENVVWVIAGLVLTTGAYFRWRGLRGRRRRAAMFAARSKQQKLVQEAAKSKFPKRN